MLVAQGASVLAEGFRLTPTEQGVGTIAVAITGIAVTAVVTSIWNRRTLERADSRHRADRQDKYADTIRTAIVDVVHQSLIWEPLIAELIDALVVADRDWRAKGDSSKSLEKVRESATAFEGKSSDLKRATIAASLAVSDEGMKATLTKILDTIKSTDKRMNEILDSDQSESLDGQITDFVLFPRPLSDLVEELVTQTGVFLSDRTDNLP
ncbi:hypothetical protein ACFYTS_26010 [Nocardia sp. NPDC004151]|uniref:hypothetical protein n=1 Tax=Nocardia sp. NPDC004151 TaxID=3364304 RepID=UPI00367A4AB1